MKIQEIGVFSMMCLHLLHVVITYTVYFYLARDLITYSSLASRRHTCTNISLELTVPSLPCGAAA